MNDQQFQLLTTAFLQQAQQDSSERQAIALTQTEASKERAAKQDRKSVVEAQIAATVRCSGATSMSVREWFAEVEMTRSYFAEDLQEPHKTIAVNIDTLKVVNATLQGEMRRCYQAFVDEQPNRLLISWQEVKNHLTLAYLTADEEEYLKSALEKTKQRTEETNGSYGRRFKEAAAMAYSATARNPAVEAILLNRYIRGLKKESLKRRLIQEEDPQTVGAAIKAIERFTVQEVRMKRVLDNEHDPSDAEPMEVGVVGTVPRSHPTSDPALLAMQRSMEGLHKELAKLKANTIYVADPRPATQSAPVKKNYTRAATPLVPTPEALVPLRQRRPFPVNPMGGPSFTPDKVPICHECQQVGHIAKDCEVRRTRLANVAVNQALITKTENQGN